MPLTQRHKKYRSPGNTISVLLIEDDPNSRLLISFHLKDPSLDVEIANNEDQATEQAASGKIDMIFTGINLPEMGGVGLVERIRSEGPAIPVIAIIETSDRDTIINCIDSRYDDYVIKPILKKDLYRILERFLQFDRECVESSNNQYGS